MTSPDTMLDKSDPGDDVAARFNYQHCYAAMNALRLISDEQNLIEVICENHEDFLLKKPNGKFIGTQIKTRLPTLPTFKAKDAQVKKALIKFCILDNRFIHAFDSFDFTTNHSFWADEETHNNLPWILKALRERGTIKCLRANNPLRAFVEDIASAAGLSTSDVSATLQKVIIRDHGAGMDNVRASVREAVSECPGMKERPYSTVAEIADAIIGLARNASSNVLKGPTVDLYALGTDLSQVIDDQRLLGKRICKIDVLTIINQVTENSTPYQDIDLAALVTPADVPADLVRAVRKLARGGVEAGRVTNMEDRVRSFEALFIEWSRKYGTDEATKRVNNILAAVQLETAEAQACALNDGEPYGSAMFAVLADRLKARAKTDADQLYNCRPEHLLGAAGILTEKCKIWWSSYFDASEEAQ